MDFRPRDYDCKICGASYSLQSSLNIHIQKTHYPETLDTRTDSMKLDDLIRRVDALEARVRMLEEENQTLKAGK